jgi:hypothetical protein
MKSYNKKNKIYFNKISIRLFLLINCILNKITKFHIYNNEIILLATNVDDIYYKTLSERINNLGINIKLCNFAFFKKNLVTIRVIDNNEILIDEALRSLYKINYLKFEKIKSHILLIEKVNSN